MGSFWSSHTEVCDQNHDYDISMATFETETNNKNAYYWFGAYDEKDLNVYELMESD